MPSYYAPRTPFVRQSTANHPAFPPVSHVAPLFADVGFCVAMRAAALAPNLARLARCRRADCRVAPSYALMGRHVAIRAVDIAGSLARDAQRSFALIKNGATEKGKASVLLDARVFGDTDK